MVHELSQALNALLHPFSYRETELASASLRSRTLHLRRPLPQELQEQQQQPPPTPTVESKSHLKSAGFSNAFFAIGPSPLGGLGAFATAALPVGTVILEEEPLFVAAHADLLTVFGELNRKKQKAALGLFASPHHKSGTLREVAVWHTNCFAISPGVAGLFPIAARFNHACRPSNNVHFEYDHEKCCLRLTIATEIIQAGDELKVSYGLDGNPWLLYKSYGFRCSCGACDGLSDDDLDKLQIKW